METQENKNNLLVTNSSKEVQTFTKNTVTLYNTTLKIRDFDEDNREFWTKTRMTLAKCSLMLGSKIAPTDEEYFVLKETLIKSFKDFSPEEIVDAFDKLIAGKLDVEADKYGKITAAYLGQVLIAQRQYRNKALSEELKNQPQKVKVVTDEEKLKIREDYLEKCLIKPFKMIGEIGFFDVDKVVMYELWLLFIGKDLVKVSPEMEKEWKEKAIQDLFNDAKKDNDSYKPILKHIEGVKDMAKGNNKKMSYDVHKRACVLFMYDHLLRLHKSNRDIKMIAKEL